METRKRWSLLFIKKRRLHLKALTKSTLCQTLKKPARQGRKLAGKGAYIDVSNRSLQVHLTQQAKIPSNFSLFEGIFAFVGFVSGLRWSLLFIKKRRLYLINSQNNIYLTATSARAQTIRESESANANMDRFHLKRLIIKVSLLRVYLSIL